jgi:hypothetical protein
MPSFFRKKVKIKEKTGGKTTRPKYTHTHTNLQTQQEQQQGQDPRVHHKIFPSPTRAEEKEYEQMYFYILSHVVLYRRPSSLLHCRVPSEFVFVFCFFKKRRRSEKERRRTCSSDFSFPQKMKGLSVLKFVSCWKDKSLRAMGKNGPHTQKRNKKKKKSCFLSKNLMAVVITTRKPEDQVRFFSAVVLFYFTKKKKKTGEDLFNDTLHLHRP